MKSLSKNKSGFSLVEILVVMGMLGIIMGAVYSLFITNQRTAYTSDETVEVQQNLRIAMDAITKDLRMAGMLVDTSVAAPISAYTSNNGAKIYGSNSPAPNTNNACPNCDANPAATGSDTVTISMISASGVYARVAADAVSGSTSLTIAPAVGAGQASDGELFATGDMVSIIRPYDFSLLNTAPYNITGAPTTTAIPVSTGVDVKAGDIIAKVNNLPSGAGATPYPNTVLYAVVSNGVAATATQDPNCPVNQSCLTRLANGDPFANRQIVAQNIADFQLRYILDDNSVSDAPPDLTLVKAVIVTIWGETATTRMLSANTPKIRQLSSVVKLRNRR